MVKEKLTPEEKQDIKAALKAHTAAVARAKKKGALISDEKNIQTKQHENKNPSDRKP